MRIDYGRGLTNVDHETGIRYGIIPANRVEYWNDSAEFEEVSPICPLCQGDIEDFDEEKDYPLYSKYGVEEYQCNNCKLSFSSDHVFPEDSNLVYNNDGYSLFQSYDDPDIWVFKSPYYTLAGFCSPCAPGAVYLTDESPDAKGYCLGHDWFEGGKAPYKVFDVKTGRRVKA